MKGIKMKDFVKISSYIEEDKLLDAVLEHIEDTESTDLVLNITKWLLSEVDASGEDCEDSNMKEVRKLLKGK